MDIESIRSFCLTLPAVTEDVKWDNDLCFSVAGKMFCVACLEPPFKITVKVRDDEFDELCATENVRIADYVGRYKWITVMDPARFSDDEWRSRITESHRLIAEKLPKKLRETVFG
jgi:predicted DNA-binding protein (MmcQ/YjbR family)